jgi:hypothetical protein
MRRSSQVARTVAPGIITNDVFGALINASRIGHHAIPPAWMIANRPEADRSSLSKETAMPERDKDQAGAPEQWRHT